MSLRQTQSIEGLKERVHMHGMDEPKGYGGNPDKDERHHLDLVSAGEGTVGNPTIMSANVCCWPRGGIYVWHQAEERIRCDDRRQCEQ